MRVGRAGNAGVTRRANFSEAENPSSWSVREPAQSGEWTRGERDVVVIARDGGLSDMLSRVLPREVRVVICTSSAEVAGLTATTVDAVIVDMDPAEGDGLALLGELRGRGCHAPVLVVTSSATREVVARVFDMGARHLVTPADAERIVAFVENAVERGEGGLERVVERWRRRYAVTKTEGEILLAAAEGASREEQCTTRKIARATFERHVHNLIVKTGDDTLLDAVAHLLREHRGVGGRR